MTVVSNFERPDFWPHLKERLPVVKSIPFVIWASLALPACMMEQPPSRLPQDSPPPPARARPSATPMPATENPPEVPSVSLPIPRSTPEERHQGDLVVPSKSGDAGNAVLQAGEQINVVWQDPPVDGIRYEFILLEPSETEGRLIGIDLDSSDGVAIVWTVPEGLSEVFMRGVASLSDGQIVYSHPSLLLNSGRAPPEGVCSISSSTIGAVTLFERRDLMTSPEVAYLAPGAYAIVYQRAASEWYLVETSEALSSPSVELMPEIAWAYGGGDAPFSGSIQFHGQCVALPFADD